ncbi:hypothetical protein Thermus77412_24490 [Thermus antranikianii]
MAQKGLSSGGGQWSGAALPFPAEERPRPPSETNDCPRVWPKVEVRLPELTQRYEGRSYPDGNRAVVCGDLEAPKVRAPPVT